VVLDDGFVNVSGNVGTEDDVLACPFVAVSTTSNISNFTCGDDYDALQVPAVRDSFSKQCCFSRYFIRP